MHLMRLIKHPAAVVQKIVTLLIDLGTSQSVSFGFRKSSIWFL